MIPAPFGYVAAASVGEAAGLLRQHGEEAKLLAGGHSLIPLMRLRLAQPTVLVDISSIRDLSYVRVDGDRVRIGAMTRHVDVEESAEVKRSLPLLAEVAAEVGDVQVRSMGTIGGVLAHADPAGDYTTLALMFDATITTNKRSIPANAFFLGLFAARKVLDQRRSKRNVRRLKEQRQILPSRDRALPWMLLTHVAFFVLTPLEVVWNEQRWTMEHICRNAGCRVHGVLPVWGIDDEIYRHAPAVLVGTVDKEPHAAAETGRDLIWAVRRDDWRSSPLPALSPRRGRY